jgi:hypothetical protein
MKDLVVYDLMLSFKMDFCCCYQRNAIGWMGNMSFLDASSQAWILSGKSRSVESLPLFNHLTDSFLY